MLSSYEYKLVYRPKIDQNVEKIVKQCYSCQFHHNSPASAPMHPRAQPERSWSRLHMDFAGPFLGHYFLIVVDAFPKWLEVERMGNTTARATVLKLQHIFATHGVPEVAVTDNGPTFISIELGQLMQGNDIKHITISPYHPASNGLAERAAASFKSGMKKMQSESGSLESKIDRFIFQYQITPRTTTGEPQRYYY
jgi:transposase InsO family protein